MAKFTVITACRNAAAYIEETVRSVLSQSLFASGRCELEYLVYDGASSDGTVEVLRRFERDGVKVTSERDGGFYDALAKGLKRATGDYVAYLNAGDLFHPGGLAVAADCFDLPGVDWLTGYTVTYNERSQATRSSLPFRFRRELFACGAYGSGLPYLQQESTAWRRSLQRAVDFDALAKLRYAGDFYLWRCFASLADLQVVRGQIGGFRIHRGQISERIDAYRAEVDTFCRAADFGERLHAVVDRLLWNMPEWIKALAGDARVIVFDHAAQEWRRVSYGEARRYR